VLPLLLLATLALLPLGSGLPSAVTPRSICTSDLEGPLRVQVEREDAVRPGLPVRARVLLTAARSVDQVEVRYLPQPGVGMSSKGAWNPGRLRAGEARSDRLTVTAPSDRTRRTVEVQVQYSVDGIRYTQGAVLNLVFEEEASRTVTTPDGRRVHEVAARRIG